MKRLQITQFTRIDNPNIVYKLNNNSGDYEYKDGAAVIKAHLYTFFGDTYKITGILDKLRQIEFKVGKIINTPNGNFELLSIKILGDSVDVGAQFRLMTNVNDYSVVLMSKCKLQLKKQEASTNGQIKEFAELEQRILNDFKYTGTLKFNVFKKKKTETFEDFKKQFFQRNHEFDTINSSNGSTQTTKARRRSLGDIFMICKYYYPNISLQTIIAWLYGKNTPGGQFCGTIQKRVFRHDYKGAFSNAEYKDEYGNSISYYQNLLKNN